MTQYYADADNGLDAGRDGLAATSTTHAITSSSIANPTNILAVGHGLSSTDETIISGHSGSTPDINGVHVVTVIDVDNFTIPVNVTTGGTGGTCTDNDGPWASIDKFADSGRSAGDILTCRRGTTADYSDGTSLSVIGDGTPGNPITMEADYDDVWGDFVNSTQTFTMVFGSKTHTASATITGISAGDWIYNSTDGDDPREYSYEVESVSGTTLTLYLPFKGSTGATKTLKVMGPSPTWTSTSNWSIYGDEYWLVQGIRGINESSQGLFRLVSGTTRGWVLKDFIVEDDVGGSSGSGVYFATNQYMEMIILKSRFYGKIKAIDITTTGVLGYVYMKECLIDGNSYPVSVGISNDNNVCNCILEEVEFKNHVSSDIKVVTNGGDIIQNLQMRNCQLNSTTKFINTTNGSSFIRCEDYQNTVNDTRVFGGHSTSVTTPMYQSDTGTVRSGGGSISLKVTPGTTMGSNMTGLLKLLDIPFYTSTSSKTYSIYFRPDATANWTTDPTSSQLWVELEAWGHATNNFRKITKSTGTIDMNGSTAWQALSVTVAPAQAGVSYLRVWYGKPKESAKTNVFFVDPKPVIT